MIGVIGIKRLVVLFVFIVINALLGAVIYLHFIPEQAKVERQHKTLKRQLRVVQGDIDRMQLEFEQLDQQQDRFDALKDRGFFSTQERSDAKSLFSEIQVDSNVISATVNVKPGIVEDNYEAKKANHKLLTSSVSVDIQAFDDGDVYRYLEMAQERFPGYLMLNGIEIKRIRDVSSPVLRAIASGANPEMIEAKISMSWKTLIPESQVIDGGTKR